MPVMIGCDPEVFVKQNNNFISAYGLIKGDKRNPQPVDKGAVQVDGMALEFNIDPAKNENEFVVNIQTVFGTLKKMVEGYDVVVEPVAHFNDEYFNNQPKESKILGCDPDFNGWTCYENERPNSKRPMRTAAGHIHIGFKKQGKDEFKHFLLCCEMAKQLDVFLGIPSLFYDEDTERRSMYGKAGCFRPKPYGMEYRTLSNAWLKSEAIMRWVYRATQKAVDEFKKGNHVYKRYTDIQEIINNSNKERAIEIIQKENLMVA